MRIIFDFLVSDKSPLLTQSDVDMLQRWTKMQQKTDNVPTQPPNNATNQPRSALSPKNTMVNATVGDANVFKGAQLLQGGNLLNFVGTHHQQQQQRQAQVIVLQASVAQDERMRPTVTNDQTPFTTTTARTSLSLSRQTNDLPRHHNTSLPPPYVPIQPQGSQTHSSTFQPMTYERPPPEYPSTHLPLQPPSIQVTSTHHTNADTPQQMFAIPTQGEMRSQTKPFQTYQQNPHLHLTTTLSDDVSPAAQIPSTSHDVTTGAGDNSDDILNVITQFRKSQVADPLLLALTPKTGGEPYGVGPDVLPEDFLAEEK